MLLKREVRLTSTCKNYFSLQTELKPGMRREVASWMMEVCEEEGCSSQVFCLAINYLDRFLSTCKIARNQLQLLGAVCLLVSWKVRAHSPITAQRLVEYTDYNVTVDNILEWEFLLLSRLDWDLSAVIAPDFVEHILQRLLRLEMAWDIEMTRKNADTLIYLCYSHFGISTFAPSLIAVSSIMTSLRPRIEAAMIPVRDTPSPSSSSSSGSVHSSPEVAKVPEIASPLDKVIESLQKITLTEKSAVLQCMQQLEQIMQSSLHSPPSPVVSDEERSPLASSTKILSSSPIAPRILFSDSDTVLSQQPPV